MNKIIVKYKNNNHIDNCINYNQNQCIICSDKYNLIILENNFCQCFKYVIFCEECFLNWLFNNCKCLICRDPGRQHRFVKWARCSKMHMRLIKIFNAGIPLPSSICIICFQMRKRLTKVLKPGILRLSSTGTIGQLTKQI